MRLSYWSQILMLVLITPALAVCGADQSATPPAPKPTTSSNLVFYPGENEPECGPKFTACPISGGTTKLACFNLLTSNQHCGECETSCKLNEICQNGSCCTSCSGVCKNLQNDPNFCGSCTTKCLAGETCCNGTCRNLQNDPNFCGSCTTKCLAGETCCNGTCQPPPKSPVSISGYPSDAIWPIENPPKGKDIKGMQDTFGPREKSDGSLEFHRGIDIPTPEGTTVRAILPGTLTKVAVKCLAGTPTHTQYRVEIKHFKTNLQKSFKSSYSHLKSIKSNWGCSPVPSPCPNTEAELTCKPQAPATTIPIEKGEEIGTSGYNSEADKFFHLHFEIRDSDRIPTPNGDTSDTYTKFSVHPLRVLPYPPTATATHTLECPANTMDKSKVVCTVNMKTDAQGILRQDLARVELLAFKNCTWAPLDPWTSVYDFDLFNMTFTHTKNDWNNNVFCPVGGHGASYDQEFHLKNPSFNGVTVDPVPFTGGELSTIHFTFKLPTGITGTKLLVRAWNIRDQFKEVSFTAP